LARGVFVGKVPAMASPGTLNDEPNAGCCAAYRQESEQQVGTGAGSYVMETEIRYVGHGAGNLSLKETGAAAAESQCLRAVGAALLAALALVSLLLLLPKSPPGLPDTTTTTTLLAVVKTSYLHGDDLASVVSASVSNPVKGPYHSFNARLNHTDGQRFGVHLTAEFNSLYVDEVGTHGSLAEWNQDHKGEQVRRGDRIVDVNGIHGSSAQMLDECDKLSVLNLTVLRVTEGPLRESKKLDFYKIILDRTDGSSFGAYCALDDTSLLIKSITGGLFAAWNEENPDMQVRPGDRIVAVNSVQGSGRELLTECNQEQVLEIKLLHGEGAVETSVVEQDVTGAAWSLAWREQTLTRTTTSTSMTATRIRKHVPTTSTTDTPESTPGGTTTRTGTVTTTVSTTTTTARIRFLRGLKAEFFYDVNFNLNSEPMSSAKLDRLMSGKPDLVRIDPQVYYPVTLYGWPGIRATDQFVARWSGQLLIAKSGRYTFELKSDDGSSLSLDGTLLIGAFSHPGQDQAFDPHVWLAEPAHARHLEAGEHDIEIRYFNTVLHEGLIALYSGPDTENRLVTIPAYALQCNTTALPDQLLRDAVYLRRFASGRLPWLGAASVKLLQMVIAGVVIGGLLLGTAWSAPKIRYFWRSRWGRKRYSDLRRILAEERPAQRS